MPTYTYQQIHQLTTQAGYQGAQADAIANQLFKSQGSTDASKPAPTLDQALSQLGLRGGKLVLGAILAVVGLVAVFGRPIANVAEQAAPPLRAASMVENIRASRSTRKLREVQRARATEDLQRSRASGPIAPPTRSPQGGTMGEQPGNEPTSGGRPVKPAKTPKVATPRSAEQIAWERLQREKRKRTPNVTAAEETWRAVATPEDVARRQGQTIRRNNQSSAGERETPIESIAEQRSQERKRRTALPSGTMGAQPARRKRGGNQNQRDNEARLRAQRKLQGGP